MDSPAAKRPKRRLLWRTSYNKAAAPEIPQKLLDQLAIGGSMVIPFGEGNTQKMLRIKRLVNNHYEKEIFDTFTFVPMLKGIEN